MKPLLCIILKRLLWLIVFLWIAGCQSKKNITEDFDYTLLLSKTPSDSLIKTIDSLIYLEDLPEETKALFFLKRGTWFLVMQDDKTAILNYEKALEIFKKNDNKKNLAKTYWHLGSANAFLSKKKIAFDQLMIARDLCIEIKDSLILSKVNSSISHTYFLYNDYSNAIDYIFKAIELNKILKDSLGLSSSYNNLAILYRNTNDFEKALDFNLKSLDINIFRKDTVSIA
jgi:tetratricopeptide (TPR) repeat protein